MTDDNHRELQETKSSRRSLDFSTSAEKPFVDNPQTQRNSSANDNVKASLSEGTRSEVEKTRKVQFVTRIPELQKAETNIAENTCENTSLTQEDQGIGSARQSPKVVGETEELRKGHSKPESPQRYTDHLRILAYLVGELRAILASSGTINFSYANYRSMALNFRVPKLNFLKTHMLIEILLFCQQVIMRLTVSLLRLRARFVY
jgi:hypothetical protein